MNMKKYNNRWIPVSERLPKRYENVLLNVEELNPSVLFQAAYYECEKWSYSGSGEDVMKDLDGCSVTHWMPLPEPPTTTKQK